MRTSLGLSTAESDAAGNATASREDARKTRREITVMTTSMTTGPGRVRHRALPGLMNAGFLARRQLGEGGGPRALAAFIERPQAACSNRRCTYFLGSPMLSVNGKKRGDSRLRCKMLPIRNSVQTRFPQ